MRPITIVLQAICFLLGCLFLWTAKFALAGVVVGSLMFLMASLLGADHLSNPGASGITRLTFKVMAFLAVLPLLCLMGYHGVTAAIRGDFVEALSMAGKFVVLAGLVFFLAFDTHPTVRRLLQKRGLSTPEK